MARVGRPPTSRHGRIKRGAPQVAPTARASGDRADANRKGHRQRASVNTERHIMRFRAKTRKTI